MGKGAVAQHTRNELLRSKRNSNMLVISHLELSFANGRKSASKGASRFLIAQSILRILPSVESLYPLRRC